MSALTSRMSLYKPGSSENVNVTSDLNNNLDALDLNMNFRTCTSSTRPSTVWDGLSIHETDTNKCYFWNASPATSGWKELYSEASPFSTLNLTVAATGSVAINEKVTGDSQNRFQVLGDGTLGWGSGSGAPDVNLYRSAADNLKTDDNFHVAGNLFADATGSSSLVVAGDGQVTKGLAIGGSQSFGGGSGVLHLNNATTAPTGVPSSGVVVYASGNTLYQKDANGLNVPLLAATQTAPMGSGTIAESIPRWAVNNQRTLGTGVLNAVAVFLCAGQVITNISFISGNSGAAVATISHWWFNLMNSGRTVVATTTNATSEAWAINTRKTKALTAPYTVPTTGTYYVGVMMAASTPVSLLAVAPLNANAGTTVSTLMQNTSSDLYGGTLSTGNTTPITVGNTGGSFSSTNVAQLYCYLT